MFGYYYGESTRKLVIAFGTLFNNIYTEQSEDGTPQRTRVPLTYAPKEKFVRRLLEESSISPDTKIGIRLPQISFALNRIAIDPSRRRNKVNTEIYDVQNGEGKRMLVEVPINVNFNMYIYTRQITHTLQIIEQIIPYFNPEYILKINYNDARQEISVPLVMLNDININERYDGDFGSRRINMSSIGFVAKAHMFAPVDEGTSTPVINTFDIAVSELNLGDITIG
jgi:hypothetical protein